MSLPEPSGPDLVGVVRDADKASLPDANQVVLRFLRLVGAMRAYDGKTITAEDVGREEHLRLATMHGIVDIMRGGMPPLDYDTVARYAVPTEVGSEVAPVAALRSVVGFKRLANRPRDKNDLEELEALHDELPIDRIAGLDDDA